MTESLPPDRTPQGDQSHANALRARIERLESEDESAFGEFGTGDWLLCVLGSLIIPAVVAWWFAG